MILVLGPEHRGRAQGLEGNVGYKKFIEGYVRKKRTFRQQEDDDERVKQLTIEDFKSSELWAEMKKVMMEELREELRNEKPTEFAERQDGLQIPGLRSNSDGSTISIIKFDSIKVDVFSTYYYLFCLSLTLVISTCNIILHLQLNVTLLKIKIRLLLIASECHCANTLHATCFLGGYHMLFV